jgi:Cytochrome c oxidase assembly protein CtaG/Cox11
MKLLSAIVTAVLLLAPGLPSEGADALSNLRDPTRAIEGYVRAIYAHDYIDAYRYISNADQRIRDVNRYAQQRGAFMGSALEITRKLASFIEIKPSQKQIAPSRIQAITRLAIPEPSQLSPLLFDFDLRRLNALEMRELSQIIESLDQKKRDGSFKMIEVEEKFELVKEGDEWRIFLNWAAGVKIPLRLVLANAAGLDVALSQNEVVVQPGELFEIELKIKNRSAQQVVARIGHLIEPQNVANFLDFVECGFLLPVTLQPGKEHAYSARYLLRDNLPDGVQQLSLTYDFRLLK